MIARYEQGVKLASSAARSQFLWISELLLEVMVPGKQLQSFWNYRQWTQKWLYWI